jgi:DNA-binding transcriptional LysR family regulator
MAWQMNFDWALVQTFLAVVDQGSFSAAARATGTSQPTVGRQIQELERQLGTTVFQREVRGHRLTDAGLDLVEHARAMEASAARLHLTAAGQSATLNGVVRITASVVVSNYLLPPILSDIRQAEPAIELELHPSDDTENLLFREADIAVRMYRPEQLDVITKKVGAQKFGLFATQAYLDRHSHPVTMKDLSNHDMVGYDRSDLILKGMREMGIPATRSDFPVRCDNQTVYMELVRAGCGIGIVPMNIARQFPELVQVLPSISIPDLPIWLTAHEALRTSRRVRRVYDMLAEGLGRIAPDRASLDNSL